MTFPLSRPSSRPPLTLLVLALAACSGGAQDSPETGASAGPPSASVSTQTAAPGEQARIVTEGEQNAAASGEGVRVEGRITDEGVECPALRTADGALYTLAGAPDWVSPGDRVVVQGDVAEMSFCQQGTTISVRSIERMG